jgi:hypothetical protein
MLIVLDSTCEAVVQRKQFAGKIFTEREWTRKVDTRVEFTTL